MADRSSGLVSVWLNGKVAAKLYGMCNGYHAHNLAVSLTAEYRPSVPYLLNLMEQNGFGCVDCRKVVLDVSWSDRKVIVASFENSWSLVFVDYLEGAAIHPDIRTVPPYAYLVNGSTMIKLSR